MTAPDLTSKVLGFRAFGLTDGGFHSIGVGEMHWLPGPNKARCLARHIHDQRSSMSLWSMSYSTPITQPPKPARHDAPQHNCDCGFYGLHKFDENWLDGGLTSVVGAILAWGRMEIHRTGFRAEYAEVVMVAYEPMRGLKAIREIERAASAYGVRAVSIEDLQAGARQFGRPVSEELLPKPEAKQGASAWPATPLTLAAGSTSSVSMTGGSFMSTAAAASDTAPTRRVRDTGTKVRAALQVVLAAGNVAFGLIAGGIGNVILAPIFLILALLIWFRLATWTEVPA